jgi:TPR repeat protein
MLDLIMALHESNREQESAEWVQRLGESEHLHMIGPLTEWLEGQRRDAEAEAWLRRYADLGDLTACCNLSELLERAGRNHEAVAVWRKAIESFTLRAMSTIVARKVAKQIVRANESTEAVSWLRGAADDGCPHAILILIELTEVPDAEDLLRRSMTLGNTYSTPSLVEILERIGRTAEAEILLRLQLENLDYPYASEVFKKFLVRNGRAEEAKAFEKFGIEPGGKTASPW